jgi:hypothetical protein
MRCMPPNRAVAQALLFSLIFTIVLTTSCHDDTVPQMHEFLVFMMATPRSKRVNLPTSRLVINLASPD